MSDSDPRRLRTGDNIAVKLIIPLAIRLEIVTEAAVMIISISAAMMAVANDVQSTVDTNRVVHLMRWRAGGTVQCHLRMLTLQLLLSVRAR